ILYRYFLFFFFSSRRRHTRSKRDWSSDVCSSDLNETFSSSSTHLLINHVSKICLDFSNCSSDKSKVSSCSILFSRYSRSFSLLRSEERRVGKECRSRWAGECGKKINKHK